MKKKTTGDNNSLKINNSKSESLKAERKQKPSSTKQKQNITNLHGAISRTKRRMKTVILVYYYYIDKREGLLQQEKQFR